MNKLSTEKRAQIIRALIEGCSLRSTTRMTGCSVNTVTKLLIDAGIACARFQHDILRKLPCKRLQCDEIWSFVGMKQKNVPEERKGEEGIGDVWTWVAIDADTKLVPSWLVGARDIDHAIAFMNDVASRLANPVQLTTDGLKVYWEAVGLAFYKQPVDYAMLVKKYGAEPAGEGRYSPPKCTGCDKKPLMGNPDPAHISTSFVERQNLTMRMRMRRFTRLTNAFSKKVENLEHAVALHFMHYNFVARHQTLKVTPAMAAGVDRHLWSIEEIVEMIG